MDFSNFTITDIAFFAEIPIESGSKKNMSNRPQCGLLFSPNGRSYYIQNGVYHVNDNQHILLLPQYADYDIVCEQGDVCPLINFTCNTKFNEIQSFYVPDSAELLHGFYNIKKQWTFGKQGCYLNGMAYLYKTFAALTGQQLTKKELPEILQKGQSYIAQNLSNPTLNAEEIAGHLHISAVYFRKLFQKHHSMPLMQYITHTRIEQAKILLDNGVSSVEQIAELCGFNSLFSFSRTFKNKVGRSPSAYRQK